MFQQIEGVLCINPGTLVRGDSPGTYANLYIDPLDIPEQDLEGTEIAKKALERIRVDVVNIN